MTTCHTPLILSGQVLSAGLNEPRTRRQYQARFIRAGQVFGPDRQPANLIIEPEAIRLAALAGKFNHLAVFLDHAGLFENPSIKDLIGKTQNAAWSEEDQAVIGEIVLYNTAARIADLLDELLSEGSAAPDIGLSIVFWPIFAQRSSPDEPRRVSAIQHIESVDLVFQPAADGRILQALSAFHQSQSQGETIPMTQSSNHQTPDQAVIPNSSPKSDNAANRPLDCATNIWLPFIAKTAAASIIANSGLPIASQERLRQREYSTPQELEDAINTERMYIAALSAANVIQIGSQAPRAGSIQLGMDAIDRVSLALEALMMGVTPPSGVPPLSGIREAYVLLSGDYEMTGIFHPDRVQLANVNSSTMAGLVANALNKTVVNEFQQYPQWWSKIATVMDFSTLQAVRWMTLGGVGELPTVAEGAAYTELTWDDLTETASFVKKGGYLGITLEAIDKDETRRLQAAPRALAQAAWLTLSKSVSNIFTANSGVGPTMSDSLALFHSSHGNIGSSALSVTTWAAARLAMRKQTELNSGERLGALTAPKYLLVPPDLEITALQVLASEQDYTYTLSNAPAAPVNAFTEGDTLNARMAFARDRVIVVDLWTDTNNWAAVADPRLYASIGIGFRYGRTPEVFSVASPTAGLMFTNDTLPIKVRFFYAVGPIDYRGLYKANVAGG